MDENSRFAKMIDAKLRDKKHSKLLEILVNSFMDGGSEGVEDKIREILRQIEEA